jgi:hypothetical protein
VQEPNRDALDKVISAIERLLEAFKIERMLYTLFGVVSLILFGYAGFRLFSGPQIRASDVYLILGSSGAAALCSNRTTAFFSRALKIIEKLIRERRV